MRILAIESEPGAGARHFAELTEAGHELARCQEPGATGFRCHGLEGPGHCPIDTKPVDVAVAVRTASPQAVGGDERGVTCALRSRVPVVVISQFGHPYGANVIEPGDDLVQACVDAAAAPSAGHAAAVIESLRTMAGLPDGAVDAIDVRVVRQGDWITAFLLLPDAIERSLRSSVANRAATALRHYDTTAQKIDVDVDWAPVR
jgi:hypothetical protein